MSSRPILIIGAGMVGLCLAQALKKKGIQFEIFERDESMNHRGEGWGITLLWGLPYFEDLVPNSISSKLHDVAVNPEAESNGEAGDMPYFDMVTGEALFRAPDTSDRIRVKRHGLREMLLEGIDVKWSKTLSSISNLSDGSVVATFTDDTNATGSLLIGCDGSFSVVRSLLIPSASSSNLSPSCPSTPSPLPITLLGTTLILPSSLANPMRRLDPHYLQGGDSSTNVFFFFSFLDSPSNNSREDKDTYACQVFVGFPKREPYHSELPPPGSPTSRGACPERVRYIKQYAATWTAPFKTIIDAIPEDATLAEIRVSDWVTPRLGKARRQAQEAAAPAQDSEAARIWSNRNGTVTLAGDAAHPMTMFRGEAFSHGLLDVSQLLGRIVPIYEQGAVNGAMPGLGAAVDAYEEEMSSRAHDGVLLSRRACLDALDQANIDEASPLVTERSITSHVTQRVDEGRAEV